MDFVNPLFLFGAATAVVPLVLHLVLRQRPRQIEFPALRLILARRQANTRRLRLRHWLLLLLRMAALAGLALALARPTLNVSGLGADQELPVTAALVFDTSPRMAYRHENRTRLEAAQELGQWLARQLPGQSQVAVLESSLSSAVFQVDLGAARQRIERLTTVTVEHDLGEVLVEAARLVARGEHPRREIYLFTDLSRAGFRGGSDQLRAALDEVTNLSVYVIDVGVAEPKNVSLGALRLSGESLARTSELGVATDLAAAGLAGTRTVELWVDGANGTSSKRSQLAVDLAGGGTALDFPPLKLDPGLRQGSVRVVGEDGLTSDDVRFFTVSVEPAWPVLLVGHSAGDGDLMLVHEMLAPRAFRQSGRARFECRLAGFDELSAITLRNYAAVLVLDPPSADEAFWERLGDYAAQGGGLAIFLGPSAHPIEALNGPAPQELLPGPLAQQGRQPDGELYLAPTALDHPALARFRPLADAVPWDTLPVFRYWQFGSLAEGARTMIPLVNGEPALVERAIGTGRVVVGATAAAPRAGEQPWNLLPTGLDAWPFVMLMNELTLYLAGASDTVLNYQAGQSAVIRPRGVPIPPAFVLTAPGREPERRNADPSATTILVAPLDEVGHYRLRAGGGPEAFDAGFSVNLPSEATDLARFSPEELTALFGKTTVNLARSQEEIRREVSLGRVGRELYPWLVVLLALLLLAEQLISNWFYRDEAPAPAAAREASAGGSPAP